MRALSKRYAERCIWGIGIVAFGTMPSIGGDSPFKTNAPGRARTLSARREEILNAFEKSGLSGVAFAPIASPRLMP